MSERASPPIEDILDRMRAFMDSDVYPLEAAPNRKAFFQMLPTLQEKRRKVKELGLWTPQVPVEWGGLGLSLAETAKAPPAFGAALALEYRRIVVPIVPGRPSDDALDLACRLAAERRARIVALSVIEVPLGLPLDTELPAEELLANDELDEAIAVGDTYGVKVVGRLVRGRNASTEIVREAERQVAELIVLGSPRKSLVERRRGVFGTTVDRVLRKAPCRVMIAASGSDAALRPVGALALGGSA